VVGNIVSACPARSQYLSTDIDKLGAEGKRLQAFHPYSVHLPAPACTMNGFWSRNVLLIARNIFSQTSGNNQWTNAIPVNNENGLLKKPMWNHARAFSSIKAAPSPVRRSMPTLTRWWVMRD